MSALFASGLVINLILGLVALEALALYALHRLTGRGPAIADLLPNLAAGVCLLLAVRAALVGQPWAWVAAALAAGLLAHLLDLSRRWPASRRTDQAAPRAPLWDRAGAGKRL